MVSLFYLCPKALLMFYCTLEWAPLIPAALHAPFIFPSPTKLLFQQQGLWPALTGCDDGSFNRCRWATGAGWLWSQTKWGGLDHTFVAVDSCITTCPLKPFHPSALLSAMGWHWVQSHTCSFVLCFVSLLSRAMQGIRFYLTVGRFLNCYFWHILVSLCLCRDKVAVTLLLQSLTLRQRSMCRCPKVMSTKRRR